MAKKKIKKALKNVAKVALPMLAMAGLGKAFMNSRARPLGVSGANKALFTSNKAMRGTQIPMDAPSLSDDLMEYDRNQDFGFGLMAKKGVELLKVKKQL